MHIPSCSVKGALAVLGAGFGLVGKLGGAVGRKWLLLMALVYVPGFLHAQTPPTATYYVATTGSDSALGTSSTTPFLTIGHALGVCNGGESIAVYSGTYSTIQPNTGYGCSGFVVMTPYTNNAAKIYTSMVTCFGWGPTQPVIEPPAGVYGALMVNGESNITFENLKFFSEDTATLVKVNWQWAYHQPCSNVVFENCDISDPDSADTTQNAGPSALSIEDGVNNVTVENCYIHDSEEGLTAGDSSGAGSACTNVNILNNRLEHFTGDAIIFSNWFNVTISDNIIEDIYDTPTTTTHNDGLQLSGPDENVTITNNVIAHSHDQCILFQTVEGTIDHVLVENNLVYDGQSGGGPIQTEGVTNMVIINNTFDSLYIRPYTTLSYGNGVGDIYPTDTVVANNSLGLIKFQTGASAAYEDYNYAPKNNNSFPTGPHDIIGTTPDYVNTTDGNFHPAAGSPLFGAGIHSFSATVDGTLTNFTAPAVDLDYITRGNPPTIGAYETTAGNSSIAYSGFDYATTGAASGLTDGASDYGWVETTWTGSGTIVSPGLTYSSLPTLGDAMSFTANQPASRTINSSDMPAGYTINGSDGVARLGNPGTTVWMSFLIDPTATQSGSLNAGVHLVGQSGGGGDKLFIGDVTGTTTSWGVGNIYSGVYAYASSAARITMGQTAFLVAEITFTSGNSTINLWVNPPLGETPPATPDATLSTVDVGPFNVIQFKGSRASIGDEYNVGTSWLSVTSGGQ
jgi:hypothetical protein